MSAHPTDPDLDPEPGTTPLEVWLSAADPARDATLRGVIEGRALVTSVSREELRRRLATEDRPAAIVVDGWRPDETASVLFSSFGLNVFDIALAARVLARAEADDIGTVVPLF